MKNNANNNVSQIGRRRREKRRGIGGGGEKQRKKRRIRTWILAEFKKLTRRIILGNNAYRCSDGTAENTNFADSRPSLSES